MNRVFIFIAIFFFMTSSAFAQKDLNEKIDRGVVALTIDGDHAYIEWRLLITDPSDISFNVYRKQVGFDDFTRK